MSIRPFDSSNHKEDVNNDLFSEESLSEDSTIPIESSLGSKESIFPIALMVNSLIAHRFGYGGLIEQICMVIGGGLNVIHAINVGKNVFCNPDAIMGAAMVAHAYYPSKATAIPIGLALFANGTSKIFNALKNLQEGFSKPLTFADRISKIAGGAISATLGALSVYTSMDYATQAFGLKGNAVFIIAAYDNNGAFKDKIGARQGLAHFYKNYKSTVNSDDEICESLKKVRNVIGKPIDALLLQGHGTSADIRLGDATYLKADNLDKIARCINENLAPEAPIILSSCSTGAKVIGQNFAEMLAKKSKHIVQAPTQDLYATDCSIKIDAVTSEPRFSCRDLRNYESFNEYVSAFKPTDSGHFTDLIMPRYNFERMFQTKS